MFKFVLSVFLIGFLGYTSANDALCIGLPQGSHVNDESSCSAYFTCLNGAATPQTCPGGLYFNPDTIECDFPENVSCEDGVIVPPEPTESPEDPDKIEMFVCPDSGFHFFEHPQSCSMFIFCHDGHLSEEVCGGMHWDQDRLTCDDPEIVQCEIERNICPEEDDFDNIIRVPSTINCDSYFICHNQTTIHQECAPGLHFNPIERWCELPKDAGCAPLDGIDPEGVEIECTDDSGIFFKPHPTHCQYYFICLFGNPINRRCATGYLFDSVNGYCDVEDNIIVCPM